jgi:hypothetical protein
MDGGSQRAKRRGVGAGIREHLRANVVGYLALFVALGGTSAWAADKITSKDIAKNAVRAKQIAKNAVRAKHIKADAVTAAKLADGVTSKFYTKAQSDGRYLRSTVVVIGTIAESLAADDFETGTVSCPAGYQAVGGGVDPNNVFFGKVSHSAPTFNMTRTNSVADGQQGPANGWRGSVTTQGADTGTGVIKMAVICSPIG